jgi:hypothetical protein
MWPIPLIFVQSLKDRDIFDKFGLFFSFIFFFLFSIHLRPMSLKLDINNQRILIISLTEIVIPHFCAFHDFYFHFKRDKILFYVLCTI